MPDGDVHFIVLTSSASAWNFGFVDRGPFPKQTTPAPEGPSSDASPPESHWPPTDSGPSVSGRADGETASATRPDILLLIAAGLGVFAAIAAIGGLSGYVRLGGRKKYS
jgi:hypothetical protein